jgi:hypothetical protein
MMDKFEQLTRNAEYTLVLLANEATGDWELVDPDGPVPLPADQAQRFTERGLSFGGVIGLVSGQPRVALDVELSAVVREAITRAFVARVAYLLRHPRWCLQPDMHAN